MNARALVLGCLASIATACASTQVFDPFEVSAGSDAARSSDAGSLARDAGLLVDAGQQSDASQNVDAGQQSDAGQKSDAGQGDAGQRSDSGTSPTLTGTLKGTIRVDNFGWRTSDTKVAVVLGHAGASVQLRSATDNSVAGSYSASSQATDEDSSDVYSTVDFSAFKAAGDYYLYLPAGDVPSYVFP